MPPEVNLAVHSPSRPRFVSTIDTFNEVCGRDMMQHKEETV